jgi:DNA polymerase-1
MGYWGLPVDRERLAALVARAEKDTENARERLGMLLGPVDPDSPKQLREILRLRGVPVEKTDEARLAPYKDDPVVAALLMYRQAVRRARLFSGEDFRPHPVTGRIHPDWRLLGAPTGRMSCSHPNIQALPRDPEVRACIRPGDGWVLVKADFSQIELRIAAELSGDGRLIQAFQKGKDVHAETARLVLGREPSKEDRQLAKALNFGLLYGAGPETLATYARTAYGVAVSVDEAARLRARFFETYPVLRRWQKRLLHGEGELRTVLGRLLRPTRPTDRVNYPVQGAAADGLKVALGLLRGRLPQGARVVACIHDEVLVECPADVAGEVVPVVREAMVQGMARVLRRVPVAVESGTYQDWGVTTVDWSEGQRHASDHGREEGGACA